MTAKELTKGAKSMLANWQIFKATDLLNIYFKVADNFDVSRSRIH